MKLFLFSFDSHPTALQIKIPGKKQAYGTGEQAMFRFQDAPAQGILVVLITHFNALLQDNGSGVHTTINKMHGTSGTLDPVLQGLALGVQPRERGQQRRVDI
jgi:hypothetical protein